MGCADSYLKLFDVVWIINPECCLFPCLGKLGFVEREISSNYFFGIMEEVIVELVVTQVIVNYLADPGLCPDDPGIRKPLTSEFTNPVSPLISPLHVAASRCVNHLGWKFLRFLDGTLDSFLHLWAYHSLKLGNLLLQLHDRLLINYDLTLYLFLLPSCIFDFLAQLFLNPWFP